MSNILPKNILVVFLICVSSIRCNLDQAAEQTFRSEFVVWNVGQGLWTTLIKENACYHFDIGGEKAPWREINRSCGKKRNIINISHWDWDHLNFLKKAKKSWSEICVLNFPSGKTDNKEKRTVLSQLPSCKEEINFIQEVKFKNLAALSSNDQSRIFVLKLNQKRYPGDILLPGDSSIQKEKIWAQQMSHMSSHVKLLVLGHHGSRTSTSSHLLSHLPGLKQSIASARQAKFNHPHFEVTQRLESQGVAVIRTEDWGSIRWQRSAQESGAAVENRN